MSENFILFLILIIVVVTVYLYYRDIKLEKVGANEIDNCVVNL